MSEVLEAPVSALSAFGGQQQRFEEIAGPQGGVRILAPEATPVDVPTEIVVQEELPLAATLLLFGGGLTGNSLGRHLDNHDLITEWIPSEEYQNFDPTGLYRKMIDDYDLKGRDITVITSASEQYNIPAGRDLKEMFTMFGVRDVHVIDTHDPKQVDTPENLRALKERNYLWVEGGNQKHLLEKVLNGSEALSTIQSRCKNDKDFVFAGSSAGAMMVSKNMMFEGKCIEGAGIMADMVDTHFRQRDRHIGKDGEEYGRLYNLIASASSDRATGLGIDEGSGVRIAGGKVEIYGRGPTLNEIERGEVERGEVEPKFITVITKERGSDGRSVMRQKEYECNGNTCVMRYLGRTQLADKPKETIVPVVPVGPVKTQGNGSVKTQMSP